MTDRDDILIDEVELAFRIAYRKYRRAEPVERDELFEPLEAAAVAWVKAQNKLVEEDERATQEMINEMRELKVSIEDAANTQELILAIARMTTFLIGL